MSRFHVHFHRETGSMIYVCMDEAVPELHETILLHLWMQGYSRKPAYAINLKIKPEVLNDGIPLDHPLRIDDERTEGDQRPPRRSVL